MNIEYDILLSMDNSDDFNIKIWRYSDKFSDYGWHMATRRYGWHMATSFIFHYFLYYKWLAYGHLIYIFLIILLVVGLWPPKYNLNISHLFNVWKGWLMAA